MDERTKSKLMDRTVFVAADVLEPSLSAHQQRKKIIRLFTMHRRLRFIGIGPFRRLRIVIRLRDMQGKRILTVTLPRGIPYLLQ